MKRDLKFITNIKNDIENIKPYFRIVIKTLTFCKEKFNDNFDGNFSFFSKKFNSISEFEVIF